MAQTKPTYGDIPLMMARQLGQMYDSREIPSMAGLLAEECWGLTKGRMLMKRADPIPADHLEEFYRIMEEMKLGTPIQYVLGHAWFYGHRYHVNSNALIPRPETEELVVWAMESVCECESVSVERNGLRILDIGTGSGCIAITLKLRFPEAEVWALDVSLPALETARHNAEVLGADVRFILADILADKGTEMGMFDIIISNPPYITTNEKALMRANVLDFEPEMALFVHDQEPLVFYEAITEFSLSHLHPGGRLFFEINEAYGPEVQHLMQEKGMLNVELRKDFTGKDRMVRAFSSQPSA